MNNYETVFIARADLATNQVEELATKFETIIKEEKGSVSKKDFWGLKNLAYPIAKNKKGHYVVFEISAPPAAINEFERKMRLDESVLRYLTIRQEEPKKNAKKVVRKTETTDEE